MTAVVHPAVQSLFYTPGYLSVWATGLQLVVYASIQLDRVYDPVFEPVAALLTDSGAVLISTERVPDDEMACQYVDVETYLLAEELQVAS